MSKAKKVLVVDDNHDICTYFTTLLSLRGFDPLVAHNGIEAIEKIDETIVGVILDLSMPKMDGVELLRHFGMMGLQADIILVSAFEGQILESAALLAQSRNLHVVGSLTKPISLEAITNLLDKVGSVDHYKKTQRPEVTKDDLWKAISKNELFLQYQPQVSLKNSSWMGAEALVRWEHPKLGTLFPDAFIDIIERDSELSSALITRVIKTSAEDCRKFDSGLGQNKMISINVSPIGLTDLRFPELVDSLVSYYKLEKSKIRFEVTETSIAANPEVMLDILTRLRMKGYTLSIDDFGTGHATFENLRDLPLNEIKIDTTFVRNGTTNPIAKVIAERTVSLGHALHLDVIAEGIEDAVTWHWMRDLDCNYGQGYFIARPMKPEGLSEWEKKWKS